MRVYLPATPWLGVFATLLLLLAAGCVEPPVDDPGDTSATSDAASDATHDVGGGDDVDAT